MRQKPPRPIGRGRQRRFDQRDRHVSSLLEILLSLFKSAVGAEFDRAGLLATTCKQDLKHPFARSLRRRPNAIRATARRRSGALGARGTRQLDQQAHAVARSALADVGAPRSQAEPAMSRCAQGVSPTKFDRNVAPMIVPALRPSGALSRSPYVPLISSSYSSCSGRRHTISPVRSPAAVDPLGELVVVGDQPGVGRAERDDHRAGQRREVDDPLCAERDGVTQAVGQHEPSLGIGVVDLDRLAVAQPSRCRRA